MDGELGKYVGEDRMALSAEKRKSKIDKAIPFIYNQITKVGEMWLPGVF